MPPSHRTKSAMVPIPEGSETHSEESEYTDYGPTQEMLDQPTDLRGSGGFTEFESHGDASSWQRDL